MTNPSNICPKCKGTLLASYGIKTCINCGATPMSDKERLEWWKDNKALIAKDVKALGAKATIKKWSIPHQLVGTLTRWQKSKPPQVAAVSSKQHLNSALPPLPEFKDQWMPDVQKRWLDIWFALVFNDSSKEVAIVKDSKAGE